MAGSSGLPPPHSLQRPTLVLELPASLRTIGLLHYALVRFILQPYLVAERSVSVTSRSEVDGRVVKQAERKRARGERNPFERRATVNAEQYSL